MKERARLGAELLLADPTRSVTFVRSGDDVVDGLYVELPAWGWHLFTVSTSPDEEDEG